MGLRLTRAPVGVLPATRRQVLGTVGTSCAAGAVHPFLAACGAREQGGSPIQVTKPVTITAWMPVTGTYVPVLSPQIDLFRQANPRITVNVEAAGGTDKLQAAILAGDPPDIQQSNYIPMFGWAKQGALEPVDTYLDRRGKGDFYDWAREGSTIDGKMYEWPWMLNPTGPVVNRSLFVDKNADNLIPKPGAKADWTFDQFGAALRTATTRTGDAEKDVYGTLFHGDYWKWMYLWSNGAEVYNKDETKVIINSPEGIEALQMMVDLVNRERVALSDADGSTSTQVQEQFMNKRLAILGGSPSTVGDVDQRLKDGRLLPPFEAQFLPCPHALGKKSAAFVAIQSFLVFKQDRDKDRTRAAMLLGHHLTDNPAQKAITPIGQLPVRKSVGNIYPDDPNRTTAYAVLENARSLGRFSGNGEIRQLWAEASKAAFLLQNSPKDALDEMVRLSEPIMARTAGR